MPTQPGYINLNDKSYPVKGFKRTILPEYSSPIREGTPRRVDKALANSREEGTGYPKGLGYKRGRQVDVEGGAWKCECRIEIPGAITLPLEMESETEAAGDLSGEVAAAGRMISVNTDVGNSTGKKRTYVAVGAVLLRTVSDSDFSLEDAGITLPTGMARIYCMWEGWLTISGTVTRVLFIGGENPTAVDDSGLLYTTDPTASPPSLTQVETSNTNNTTDRPDNVYFGFYHDGLAANIIFWDMAAEGTGLNWRGPAIAGGFVNLGTLG